MTEGSPPPNQNPGSATDIQNVQVANTNTTARTNTTMLKFMVLAVFQNMPSLFR